VFLTNFNLMAVIKLHCIDCVFLSLCPSCKVILTIEIMSLSHICYSFVMHNG
jgi:hypothetical protein